MKECYICGRWYGEEHHRVFRSECKPLEKCEKNLVYLCHEHHRGTYGVHGKYGDNLNQSLKLEFQNWLEMQFLKDTFTQVEIMKILGISARAVRSLCKHMDYKIDGYKRDSIILACMGGKLVGE